MIRHPYRGAPRALLAGALLLVPAAAAAQADRIVIRREPGTPVVAVELLLAAGPSDEAAEQAGLAYLTARSATAPILPALDSLGAHLAVQARKESVAFSLTAAPDVWEEASRRLMASLFRDPASSAAAEREKQALTAELEAREASPAEALAREADAALFGDGHPWGRPAAGYASSVGDLGPADVELFLRRHFTPDRAAVAVAGPVDEEQARAFLRTLLDAAPLELSPPEPARPAGGTVRRQYGSITTWVAAGYRFAPGADVEALRMLAYLVHDRLSFGPSRRSVYNARADVLPDPAGGELRVQVVVPPAEADQWAGQVRREVASFAEAPLNPTVFAGWLRRWHGVRLLEMETPEARARVLAERVLWTPGARTAPLPGGGDITAERLQAAARALEAPVMVFLGPFEEEAAQGAGTKPTTTTGKR